MVYSQVCRVCGNDKQFSDFPKRNDEKLRNECKACTSSSRRKQYEARKIRPKSLENEKECGCCGLLKPAKEFRRHPATSDGLDACCKACRSEYWKSDVMQRYLDEKKRSGRQGEILKRYRKSHSEQINGRKRELRASAVRFVRMAESRMRTELRKKAHRAMGGKCVVCGEDRTARLCIDHVNDDGAQERLSSAGNFRTIASKIVRGEPWEGQYQLLCFNCNRRKQLKKLREADKNDRPWIRETKPCTQCDRVLALGMFATSKDRPNGVSYCKDCSCAYNVKRSLSCINKLGGKCSMCGEDDPDVLEIDHVNNDGAQKRKFGSDQGLRCKVHSGKREVQGLQILCANCNAEKSYANLKLASESQSKVVHAAEPTKLTDFSIGDLKVSDVSVKDAKEFLYEFHYAQYGRSGKKSYAARLGNKIVAVAKFSTVVRKEVATCMNMNHASVLERFCINPAFQKKNVASHVLSRVAKMLHKDMPEIRCVVSFADTAQGHVGTIYKACGWKELGFTTKSYEYVGKSGNVLNKKTLYGRAVREGMTEREYAEHNDYVKVQTPEKIKFVLPFESIP
jgi:hypothetical protein